MAVGRGDGSRFQVQGWTNVHAYIALTGRAYLTARQACLSVYRPARTEGGRSRDLLQKQAVAVGRGSGSKFQAQGSKHIPLLRGARGVYGRALSIVTLIYLQISTLPNCYIITLLH